MKKPKKEVRYGADIGYTGNCGRSHRNQVFNRSYRGRNLSTDGIFRTEEGVKGSFFFFVQKGEVIMTITSSVETITPAKAKEYLKKNTNNYRKMSRSTIRSYAEDIKNGRWELNGETIIFGKDGVLKDGQHRLAAIVLAGKPADILVVRGVETDAHKIDIGKVRTNVDILNAEGFECDATLVATANIVVNQFSGRRSGTLVQEYTKEHYAELNNKNGIKLKKVW